MNTYPRFINLDQSTLSRLNTYLQQEIFYNRAERGRFLEQIREYQKIYWAEPKEGQVRFPFSGASKLIIPLAAIGIETVHSKDMTTMFGLDQFISAKARNSDWVPVERKIELWMDNDIQKNAKVFEFVQNCDLERVKFGNCVGKSVYIKEIKTAIKTLSDGTEKEFDVVTKEGAYLESVPVARFIMPYTSTDPQMAPWCGEEHTNTPYEIEIMESSGLLKPGTLEKLKQWALAPSTVSSQTGYSVEKQQQELERKEPVLPRLIHWYEIWMGFNVDGDVSGKRKEIVVYYHYESQTFMGIRYNWFEDLRRPYRIGKYFPIEHRWTGIGICKQATEFQKEVTTQHRQRLDSGTIANTKMYKISKLSGYGPNEPIFPGKLWFLDDMTHLEALEVSDVNPSAFGNEQTSITYYQQRIGIDDLQLGMQASGTPGTATDALTRIQEAKGRHKYFFRNLKNFVRECVIDYACVTHQFGPRDLEIIEQDPEGKLVTAYIELPEKFIRDGLIIDINCVGEDDNKITDRQNFMQIVQMAQQYYQGQFMIAQNLQNPQLTQLIAQQALGATTELFRQILETFDIRNIDKILVLAELQNVFQSKTLALTSGQSQPTGGQGATGGPPQPINAQGIFGFGQPTQQGTPTSQT